MPERKRSKDLSRDTEQFEQTGGGSAGRAGGGKARDVGTRDELKRSEEEPAGVTREQKSDEQPSHKLKK